MALKRVLTVFSLVTCLPIAANALENAPKRSLAQEHPPTAEDEAMREKFNERWYSWKLPTFLEGRMNDEAAFAGPTAPAATYQAILDADFKPVTAKISSLVDARVYSSLQHQMKSKYLVEFLKKGQLEPREAKVGQLEEEVSLRGVYLELHTFAKPKPFDYGDVEVHFNYALLDRTDYHMSPYWDFGSFGPYAATPVLNPGRIAYYITSYLPSQIQNEFVYHNPVALKDAVLIKVKKGKRKALLAEIKAKKITCPQAGGCEALIVEASKAK